MELFLNLLWVLIAAGAIGVWHTCWRSEKPRSRRDSLREWTAMGCALVLLFFAVSLTDDLNAAAMLLDECSASRRNSISSHHAERSKQIVKETGPAVLPRIASVESPRSHLHTICVGFHATKFFSLCLSEGRAPPVSTL
jgi:hypothetical protein